MKHRIQTIAVISFLALLTALPISAPAFMGPHMDGEEGGFHTRRHKEDGPGLFMRFVHENMAVEAIAELSNQPPATIRHKLEGKRPRVVLAEYSIEPEAFRNTMEAKHTMLLKKLNELGYLTSDQLALIEERKNRLSERRALMQKLVEAGVANGTITREEAATLMPRMK